MLDRPRVTSSGRYIGEIVGHRARIGYASVGSMVELAPLYFYRIAPKGVTLALLTAPSHGWDKPRELAHVFAKAGCDLIMLGGMPVDAVAGLAGVDDITRKLGEELGIPVTSNYRAQADAYKALGARKVATVHPYDSSRDLHFEGLMGHFGVEIAGCKGIGSNLVELPLIPKGSALQCARAIKKEHPEADTIFFPNPHWSAMDDIEAIEKELNVNVVTSLQAIIWESLRLCGIRERVQGFGKLLSRH